MSDAAAKTTEQREGSETTPASTTTEEVTKTPVATTEEVTEKAETVSTSPTDTASKAETAAASTAQAEDEVDAGALLAQGKRDLVCGEVPVAVNKLQEACKLLAAKYGETADECAEAYFCYGKALLEMSRMESGVLGNALQGMSEDEEEEKSLEDKIDDSEKMEEEEKEKISDQVIDAMLERDEEKQDDNKEAGAKEETAEAMEMEQSNDSKQVEEKQEKKPLQEEKKDAEKEVDGEKIEGSDEEKETERKKEEKKDAESKEGDGESEDAAEEEGDTEGESRGEEESQKKEDEDDISNLQLAWETLELARLIYKPHESKEMKLKLAETNLKLGEVGLETEQYEQALGDFEACLTLQKELLKPDDRLLAETYYQLGLTCTYSCKYDDAINYYKSAAGVIESKIAALIKVVEAAQESAGKGKEKADPEDPAIKADKEIKELNEILPDIMSKIEDVADEKKSAEKVKQLVKENVAQDLGTTTGFGSGSPQKASSSTAEPAGNCAASDISHLVRKKRKTEEEVEEAKDESSKKQKTEKSETEKETPAAAAGDSKDEAKESNGDVKAATNGTAPAVNGAANGKASPEKTEQVEIKAKTIEDVKKQSEDAMETS